VAKNAAVPQPNALETLTILMPVHNERPTLRSALDRLLKVDLPLRLEVIVVDDGSTDGGLETIDDLVERDLVRLIRHDVNKGKGAALKTGLAVAKGELVSVLDADLEYDPNDFVRLLEPLLAGETTVVYGTRSFGSHTAYSFWFVLGNRFVAFWASFLFNTWLSDIETCLKLAPTPVWRSINITSGGFGVEAEITGGLLKQGYSIYELPINYKARSRQEGKQLHWTEGLKAIFILLRVRLLGR
jgi:glycosyltransferase involved in cell wall biosynthesis